MKNLPIKYVVFSLLLFFLGTQHAMSQDSRSIAGIWRSFDDETNQPAALVDISLVDGVYVGTIKKLLDPNALPTCEKCSDYRKGRPVVGMEILSDLKKQGDFYSGGRILDPDDGEIYRVTMKLQDQGSKLDVRAYIGIPLLGRTQTWIREKQSPLPAPK